MTERLTDDQRKLVEDHHDLIYYFMNVNGLTENDVIDWYGEAAVCLCRAAIKFDPKKGVKFRKYAYMAMYSKMIAIKSRQNDRFISMDYYDDEDEYIPVN